MKERIPRRTSHEQEKVADAIERLTNLNLLEGEKVLLLLTHTGEKPAGEMSFPDNQHFQARIQEVRSIMRQLGLHFDETRRIENGGPRIHFDFARDMTKLEKMRALEMRRKEISQAEWHREHGNLYGFPATAVDAFLNHKPLLEELPDHVRNTPVGRFYDRAVGMRLSQAHWQSELKVIQRWMESAHRAAPEYVSHLVSDQWVTQAGGMH